MTPANERVPVTIETVVAHLPDQPIASTRGRGWTGITVDLHGRSADYLAITPARDHHLICHCVSGRGRLIQRRCGTVHDSVISAGMSILAPAEFDSVWEGEAASSARLRVPTEFLQDAAEEIGEGGLANFELRNVFRTSDPFLEHITQLILGEMRCAFHPVQSLIVESLSYSLAAHLLRDYSVAGDARVVQGPVLSQKILTLIAGYVEANLEGQIGLADLARIADVSRFHFVRVFKRTTGFTPMAFVERMRIQKAQELLARAEIPVSEIALAVGFADQSHFTRRFHRHVGATPGAFARELGVRRSVRRAC